MTRFVMCWLQASLCTGNLQQSISHLYMGTWAMEDHEGQQLSTASRTNSEMLLPIFSARSLSRASCFFLIVLGTTRSS